MSALAVLYIILPFPIIFLVHELEEIVMARRWLDKHEEKLVSHYPQFKLIIRHLMRLDTLAFSIAAAEEFLILLAVTAAILVDTPYAIWIWISLFMVYSLHLLVHVVQIILVRGYVPGIVTTILSLPYSIYVINIVLNNYSISGVMIATLCGIVFMFGNLLFAQKIGLKSSNFLHNIMN